jgi:hypothetical protein
MSQGTESEKDDDSIGVKRPQRRTIATRRFTRKLAAQHGRKHRRSLDILCSAIDEIDMESGETEACSTLCENLKIATDGIEVKTRSEMETPQPRDYVESSLKDEKGNSAINVSSAKIKSMIHLISSKGNEAILLTSRNLCSIVQG